MDFISTIRTITVKQKVVEYLGYIRYPIIYVNDLVQDEALQRERNRKKD